MSYDKPNELERKYDTALLVIGCIVLAVIVAFLASAINGNSQVSRAHYRYHDGVVLPDATVTPGVVRTTDLNQVCGTHTSEFRHTTEKMKNQVYAEYGIAKQAINKKTFCGGDVHCDGLPKLPLYEIDHVISLELGGADDVRNLYPQPYYAHPGSHEKDMLENKLHGAVCGGSMSLKEAQKVIAEDWYQEYLKEGLDQ